MRTVITKLLLLLQWHLLMLTCLPLLQRLLRQMLLKRVRLGKQLMLFRL